MSFFVYVVDLGPSLRGRPYQEDDGTLFRSTSDISSLLIIVFQP